MLAIGSENGSVDEMVEGLAAAAPPFGAALAGVAISEGADVDLHVSNTVIERICDSIPDLGEGFICERLLTSDYGKIETLRNALRKLKDYLGGESALQLLCRKLEIIAISFGKSGANAIEDLRELAATETLRRLAMGASNPLPVRLDGAAALGKLGYGKEADDLRLAMARWASKEHREAWPDLVRALVAGGPELLALFGSDGSVESQDWADLLDAIDGDEQEKLLRCLIADPRPTDAARMAILLRRMDSTSEALSLLGEVVSDPPLLNACLAVLKRNGAGADLLTLVQDHTLAKNARVASLRALKDLCDADRLLSVAGDGAIEYMLRRRATEVACQIPLTPEQAATLTAYFDGLENRDKPSILRRRAQLLYEANRPEEALLLFQRWLPDRNPSPLMRLMHAHSLEQVGLTDEALQKYEEAERHSPGLIFANCRRAVLLSEKGRVIEAADAVENVWTNQAPDWFFPTTFLI